MPDATRTKRPKALLAWGGLSLAGLCAGAALLAAAGWLLFRGSSSPGSDFPRTLTPTERHGTRTPSPPTTPTDVSVAPSITASSPPPAATGTAASAEAPPIPPTLASSPTKTSIPPTETPSSSPTPIPPTATVSPTGTSIPPIETPSPSPTPIPPTATAPPTATPTPYIAPPRSTATTSPPTATPSPTSSASLAQVQGRVVQDGTPVGLGIVVELEGTGAVRTTTGADGRYAFDSASLEGTFRVVFSQGWSEQQYAADQVVSWAWLEGFAPSDDLTIELPDLEIGLEINSQRFEQVAPATGASFSAGQISPEAPLTFEWSAYPGATRYWVDLGREGQTTPAWQSRLDPFTSASFEGTLGDGTAITAGAYWWSVGARKQVGAYKLFVYGWPRALTIGP